MDISMVAVSLFDGGWRSSDREWLKAEYTLTDAEVDDLCKQLAAIESK